MKTKNIIITAGLLGLAYLVFKNSKQEENATQEDTSGGGGAGGGGGFPLGYHPILPPLAPLNVVVPPLPKVRTVVNLPAQYEHELDILQPNPAQTEQPNPNVLAGQPRPNYTTGSGTSTGGTTSGSTTTTGSGTTGGTTTPLTNQSESSEPSGANTNTSSSSTPPPLSGASETP